MSIIGNKLTAHSIVIRQKSKVYSSVIVSIGNLVIARGVFGGNYTETDVLKEFRRNQKRFTAVGNADLSAYARVA